jgi:hypothetical protein
MISAQLHAVAHAPLAGTLFNEFRLNSSNTILR